jgi:uncharacterized protein (TIGR02452 family)
MDKKQRIDIQEDTIKVFSEKKYTVKKKEVKLDEKLIENSISGTRKYNTRELILKKNPMHNTLTCIVNCDCLEVALVLRKYGYNVGVLNMASYKNPGGGYRTGAAAQEESIFRRTNMHLCLDKKYYPIRFDEIIHSPNVTVIKRSEALKYKYIETPETMDIITCPAVKLFGLNKKLTAQENLIVGTKVDMIFKLGIFKDNDCLVLGAFGCGAYKNPPEEVANFFTDVIKKYFGYFKIIAFAIIDDSNGRNNLQIFSETMKIDSIKLNKFEEHIQELKYVKPT